MGDKPSVIKAYKPSASAVFIDRLWITCPVPPNQRQQVVNNFKTKFLGGGYAAHHFSNSYACSGAEVDGEKTGLLIQCQPHQSGLNFFRIDFNPSTHNVSEVCKYVNMIVPGGWEYLVEHGVVTRVDPAVNVYHRDLNDVCFYAPNYRRTGMYTKGKKIETLYIGSKGGKRYIRLYDKLEQLKTKKKPIPEGIEKYIRVEFEIKKDVKFSELDELKNPFLGTSFSRPPYYLGDDEYIDELFADSIRYGGVTYALKKLPKDKRKYARELINENCCEWWQPEVLWKGWPSIVKDIWKDKSPKVLEKL